MKVTTDSCLLGASAFHPKPKTILDIGAGTGLLSLMIAQRYPESLIDATEIDEDAFQQARANVALSKWANRIILKLSSIQKFSNNSNKAYDLIISNPPYYSTQQHTEDHKQNIAWHSTKLGQEELARISSKHISDEGSVFFIYPARESRLFENIALKYDLYPFYKLNVKNREKDSIFRIVSGYGKKNVDIIEEQIVIRQADDTYSQQFKTLLKDFYLAF
ncbi:tRNA1(Val) (adenine(37)-N6)-methyltransferase [Bacteroidota bacterium]